MSNLPAWQRRLDDVLRSWAGTPFAGGQCCRGQGADCMFFLIGVFDQLHGVTAPLPHRLPLDTPWTNRPGRVAALPRFVDRYPFDRLRPGVDPVEPGDAVVVTRDYNPADHAHHGMIVGVGRPAPYWHAGNTGVCFTSLAQLRVGHVFRSRDRERWAGP